MYIVKRNGNRQEYDPEKINKAINAALTASGCHSQDNPSQYIKVSEGESVEEIQDKIEDWLMTVCKKAAKAFILYASLYKE